MKKLFVLVFIFFIGQIGFCLDKTIETEPSIINNPEIINQTETKETKPLEGSVQVNEFEEISLDKSIERPTLNIKPSNTILPVYTPSLADSRIRTRSALAKSSKLTGEEYYIAPVFNIVQEQAGNFSYGTYYGASLDNAQMTYSTSWFTRYDGKKYAITGTYSTDSQTINSSYQNMLGISPEIKLTKSLSLRDTVKTYMGVPVKKNQISLIYTPQLKKYIDSLRFELGLSQSFYENSAGNSSSIEFSTKFKL